MKPELLNEFFQASQDFAVGPAQPGAIAAPNFALHALPAQTEDGQFSVYFSLIPRTPEGAGARLPITLKGDDGTTRMGILTSPRTLRFLNIEAQTWGFPNVTKEKLRGISLAANEQTGTGGQKRIVKQDAAFFHNIQLKWTLYHNQNTGFSLLITCPSNVLDQSLASRMKLKVTLYYDNMPHVHQAPLQKSRFSRFEAVFELGRIQLPPDPVMHIEPFSQEKA